MIKWIFYSSNKIKIIVSVITVIAIIVLIIVFKDTLFKINENISDAERFYKEYNQVSVDNVFKYATAKEALELFKTESAVIFFGFKDCKWCQSYAPILNKFAKENNVDTIYYVDIKEDRANNTDDYKALIELLGEHLETDSNGNKRIYVPDVYFVQDGVIVGHNNDTSTEEGADIKGYYEEHGDKLKEKINELFGKIKTVCDDSEKGC